MNLDRQAASKANESLLHCLKHYQPGLADSRCQAEEQAAGRAIDHIAERTHMHYGQWTIETGRCCL